MKTNTRLIVWLGLIVFLITFFTLLFRSSETVFGGDPGNAIFLGFPFHFWESNGAQLKVLFGWLFLDILFWFGMVSAAWYLFVKNKKRQYLLVFAGVLGVLLFSFSINSANSCVSGFPITYHVICMGENDISIAFKVYGFFFDLAFWFLVSSFFITCVDITENYFPSKFRYLLMPILLTLMSILYDRPCEGFFCIFTGRGFPLPFFSDGNFFWPTFGIDFIIWLLILYPITRFILRVLLDSVGIINRSVNGKRP